MKDILVVGHYTHDVIIKNGTKHEKPGGPPSYMTPFLKAVNVDFHIVSKIGKDDAFFFNVHNKVHMSERPSTHFILDYSSGERVLRCPTVCDPIVPEDINEEADIAIVCGVINEILPETIKEMKKKSKVLIADIQGFCRRLDSERKVFHIDPMKTWFGSYVNLFDFVKVSLSEAKTVDVKEMRKKTNVILTKGMFGCDIMLKNGRDVHVSGLPEGEIDSTGAGDAFLAGFAFGMSKKMSVEESAQIGNYFGSLTVKCMGVPDVSKKDLQKYFKFIAPQLYL